jgi:hypothetical protein
MSPLTKVQRDRLFPANSPKYILYANIDFQASKPSRELRRLLRLLQWSGPDWPDEAKTIRFLKEHQQAFRACLEWLSSGAVVDLREYLRADGDDEDLLGQWKRDKNVAFLQLHGLDHAGVALRASDEDYKGSFYGLQMDQGWGRDPLDPICWQLLEIFLVRGTLGVKRCKYSCCGKFFYPPTAKKAFCGDSCRALQYALRRTLDKGRTEKFREKRQEYMRKYRALLKRRRAIRAAKAREKRMNFKKA